MDLSARSVVGLVLAGGFLLMLAVGMPGHLSFDSIAQLHEGHLHVRETWGPAIYAWLLGFFDGIVPGAGLYVVASALLLFVSLVSLRDLRPSTSWLAVPVALAIVASPMVMTYQAIVWKDVLFANCAIAACVALAHAARRWERPGARFVLLGLVVLLLAVAGLVRQNGLIVAACASPALACVARTRRLAGRLAWGVGLFAAVLLANFVLGAASQPRASGPDVAVDTGVRILQNYDLVGAVAKDPTFPLTASTRADPAAAATIRTRSPLAYSPQRVDITSRDKPLNEALWRLPAAAIESDWTDLVVHHPELYLRVRADDFRWLLAPPAIDRCLPIFVGVDGDPKKMADLRLPPRLTPVDKEQWDYVIGLTHTPFYSHATYLALALAVGAALLVRRDPADLPILAMLAGAVGFAASFLAISIACDQRYLYFLDIAAMTGVLYLALDPRLGRRPAVSST